MYRFDFPRHTHARTRLEYNNIRAGCVRYDVLHAKEFHRKKKVKNSHSFVPDQEAAYMRPNDNSPPSTPHNKQTWPVRPVQGLEHRTHKPTVPVKATVNYTFTPARATAKNSRRHHTRPERSNSGANVSSELIWKQSLTDTSYTLQ